MIQNQRRDNLLYLTKKHNPDIVLVNETKLSDRYKISFEEYKLIRNDRPNSTQGGGTVILIKNQIKFTNIDLPQLKKFTVLEVSILKLRLPRNNNLFIIAAYAPGNNKREFHHEWQYIFDALKLSEHQNYYILAGDLNAKHTNWKNQVNNPRGIFLNS